MAGLDWSMNGIDDALGYLICRCQDIVISHPATEVRAHIFLYLAQNQLHGNGDAVLFVEVDGTGCQFQSFQPSRQLKKILFYIMLVSIFCLICFPIFWAVLCSFKTHEEMFSVPLKILPSALTIEHYKKLWISTQIPIFFFNSFLVATGTSILTVLIASLAAYSLTRFPFPGISIAARSILFCYMLPPVLLSIPFFLIIKTKMFTKYPVNVVI